MKSRYTHQKYSCRQDHESLILVEDRDRLSTQKCKTCGKKAEHVFVTQAVNALPKSTIVYEKLENGKMRRMYVDPKEPLSVGHAVEMGFQKREIQGITAMRQFEREVTREMKEEFAAQMRGEHERKQEFDAAYHADLRALISRDDLDPFTRDFMKAALEDTSGYGQREFDPNFYNQAYSG